MISKLKWIRSETVDPYRNIAMEKTLTLHAQEGECILYLWQNQHTVVIGRNQNAWQECRVRELQEDGGHLARRLSGGGAVYHDLGNLNFSFAVRKADYDVNRQSEVLRRAVEKLGIRGEKTGRNDFEVDGRKFSGHAFFETGGCCCHHGTVMMDVDMEAMQKYLSVPGSKLRSKGVPSVRARVVNLKTLCPGITADCLSEAFIHAFEEEYELMVEPFDVHALDMQEMNRTADELQSEAWLFPPRIPFTAVFERRYVWGGIQLELDVSANRIVRANCWSDAMEESLVRNFAELLPGCRYDGEALVERLRAVSAHEAETTADASLRQEMETDIAKMILEQFKEKPGGTAQSNESTIMQEKLYEQV